LQVLKYYRNAELVDAKPGEPNTATAGVGLRVIAQPGKPSAGADSDSEVDLAATYVRLIDKNGSGDLGTYLLSQKLISDKVIVENTTYELSLRFGRNYKPYQITLKDVRKDDYVGTAMPRNYSSDIHLVDESRGVDREIHIWMNNPLRYAGETFYQSDYQRSQDGTEFTVLSVVRNAGWMIPYVSCMIVFVGLCYHFGRKLLQFQRRGGSKEILQVISHLSPSIGFMRLIAILVNRYLESKKAPKVVKAKGNASDKGRGRETDQALPSFAPSDSTLSLEQVFAALFTPLVILPFALMLLGSMWSSTPKPNEMNLREFGRLPIIADGRVKPFDTLARNTLRALSNRGNVLRRKRSTAACDQVAARRHLPA
jgi:hypothetical protein